MGCRSHCPALLRCNPKYLPCAGTESIANLGSNKALCELVESGNPETVAARQIPNLRVQAKVREINQCVTAEATAFAQVGEHRLVVRPAFHRATELTERDDRYIQFTRQSLQRPADKADLLLPVFASPAAPATGHELHVVDNNQIDAAFRVQAPRLGTDFQDRSARRVVDKDIRTGKRVGGLDQDRPFLLVDLTHTQPVAVYGRFDREQALHDLLAAHFKTEDSHACVVTPGGILGNRQPQA